MTPESTNRPSGGGLSPLMVILLISSLFGLIAATAMLVNNERSGLNDSTGDPTLPPPRSMADWRADEFQLASLDGAAIGLSNFAGRTVFINMWRTDCPPCVRELPAFQQFVREQGEDGAVVLAVNQGEDPQEVREFLEEIGIDDIPVLLDPENTLRDLYPYYGLPITYVIAPDGMVRYYKIGEMSYQTMLDYQQSAEQQG